MKPSPIQTKSIMYGEFSLSPHDFGEEGPPEDFDWTGVRFSTNVRYGRGKVDGQTVYSLFLRITLPNDGEAPAPYKLHAEVMGNFHYLGNEADDAAYDLVVVNGLSILYSALREMLMSLTSRMLNGSMILPGAHFLDSKPSVRQAQAKEKLKSKRAPSKKAKST